MLELLLLGILVIIPAIFAALGFRGRDQVVGIDLGTTFSVVALKSSDGSVTVIPDSITGNLLLPSTVSFLANGSTVVGDAAVDLRATHPLHTIFNAKRFIGRNYGEVSEDAAVHPFRVGPNITAAGRIADDESSSAADAAAMFYIGNDSSRMVSPIDVGAEVVRHMRKSVEKYLGYAISRAVITIPAKFEYANAQATRLAFEKAGFKVMRVLEEPYAAAVAYNLHKSEGVRHVLVYDIGGGTLDVSALYMNGKAVNLMAVAGDDHLGGSDFDHRMREVLESKLPSATSSPAAGSMEPLPRCDRTGLLVLGEHAKIQLSSQESVNIQCLAENGQILQLTVAREEFESKCEDLYARAIRPVQKVLEEMLMTPENIDDVVLVGGASRTPKVRQLLRDFFGEAKKLHTEIDPDVTVAYGAANILD